VRQTTGMILSVPPRSASGLWTLSRQRCARAARCAGPPPTPPAAAAAAAAAQFRRSPWARRFPELCSQLPDSALAALLRAQEPAALEAALGGDTSRGRAAALAAAPPAAPSRASRQELARPRTQANAAGAAGGSDCATPTFSVTLRRRSRGADAPGGAAPLPGAVAHWGWSNGSAAGEPPPRAGAMPRGGACTVPASVAWGRGGQAGLGAWGAEPARPGTTASRGPLGLRAVGPAPHWRPISQCPCWHAASSGDRGAARMCATASTAVRAGGVQRAFRPASSAEAKAAIRCPTDAYSLPPPLLMAAAQPAHPLRDPAGAALHGNRTFMPSGTARVHPSGRAACGFFCGDPPPTLRRASKRAAARE
jgi:hypothetical protein